VLGLTNGYEATDFACWYSKDLTPFPVKQKWMGIYLSLTPDEGAIFDLNNMHAIQWGNSNKDKNYCTTLYTLKEAKTVRAGLKQSKILILRSLNRLLKDVKMTFDLVTDTVLRQRVEIVDQEDYFEVPFSINNTYINDEERVNHISIDDILKISEP
jgi:hypothetical protein